MQKVILGICGSPRKQATEYVLTEALNTLEEKGYETELFTVREKYQSLQKLRLLSEEEGMHPQR